MAGGTFDDQELLPILPSNPTSPVNSNLPPVPELSPHPTFPLSRNLEPETANPHCPCHERSDEQDKSINHRTIPSERQLKRRPSVVYRPARRRSLSVGSRMEEGNDRDGDSSSNLELPSTVDDGILDAAVAPAVGPGKGTTLRLPDRPAPLPHRKPQRPRVEKPRPAKGKKRNVVEPVSRGRSWKP